MIRKLGRFMTNNAIACLALFVAMGGTAYAANTVRSVDIVDNEVYASDVRDDTLALGGLGHTELRPNSVRSSEVLDNALTGADVNESTLTLPPGPAGPPGPQGPQGWTGPQGPQGPAGVSSAAFAVGGAEAPFYGQWARITGRFMPEGAWAVVATATSRNTYGPPNGDEVTDVSCELRDPTGRRIGGTTDRRLVRQGGTVIRNLSQTGGAGVGPGGGDVSLWCITNGGIPERIDAVMTFIQVNRFF